MLWPAVFIGVAVAVVVDVWLLIQLWFVSGCLVLKIQTLPPGSEPGSSIRYSCVTHTPQESLMILIMCRTLICIHKVSEYMDIWTSSWQYNDNKLTHFTVSFGWLPADGLLLCYDSSSASSSIPRQGNWESQTQAWPLPQSGSIFHMWFSACGRLDGEAALFNFACRRAAFSNSFTMFDKDTQTTFSFTLPCIQTKIDA